MRRVPCVIWRGTVTKEQHVLHGTEYAARRNARITGMEFHWHEEPTFIDKIRDWFDKR